MQYAACPRTFLMDRASSRNIDAPVASSQLTSDDKIRALLYSRFIIKCQKIQTLTFLSGGVCFIAGTVFFFPQIGVIADDKGLRLTHGCWLYLAGSFIFLVGALLGQYIGKELALTCSPFRYNFALGKHRHHLYWWSDEEIVVASCNVLILGTVLFVVGTVFFFPGYPEWLHEGLEYTATVLFILGSICFLVSAIFDFLRLNRKYSKYTTYLDGNHAMEFKYNRDNPTHAMHADPRDIVHPPDGANAENGPSNPASPAGTDGFSSESTPSAVFAASACEGTIAV